MPAATERPAWWPSDAQKLRAELTTKTPAEVDGALYPILEQIGRKEGQLTQTRYLLGEIGRKPSQFGRRNVREDGLEYNDPGVQRAQFEASRDKLREEIAELEAEAMPLEREYDRRPWTRYIVVPGGHLHKRSCHTLTPGRTMVGQIAEASGLDEAEVVAKFDETACTHCFPNAPVAKPKTPAEEGYCEYSGEFVDASRARRVGMREIAKCACGSTQTLTSTGKFRKHKAGAA